MPQQATEFIHAHGGVEFGMRHLEAESLFDVVHRRKVQHQQAVVQVENFLLVFELHVDGRVTLHKRLRVCHRAAPVNAVVAAVLVLGREHKQVLVFGVEQLHRIHHVDESRGCGIATETVDVRRFYSSVIRMQFLVLRNRGTDPH